MSSEQQPVERLGTGSLLRQAQAGDEEALEQLLSRYLPPLKRWARGRLPAGGRGMVETDDIVQEVMAGLLRNLDRFEADHSGAFHAYARRAIVNRIKDEYRRAQRRAGKEESAGRLVDRDPSQIEVLVGRELYERYEEALDRLKPDDREAVIAKVELHKSYLEIAEELDKPSVDAARMAVSRALVRLAEEMSDGA